VYCGIFSNYKEKAKSMHKLCTGFDKEVLIGSLVLLGHYEGHYDAICLQKKKYFILIVVFS